MATVRAPQTSGLKLKFYQRHCEDCGSIFTSRLEKDVLQNMNKHRRVGSCQRLKLAGVERLKRLQLGLEKEGDRVVCRRCGHLVDGAYNYFLRRHMQSRQCQIWSAKVNQSHPNIAQPSAPIPARPRPKYPTPSNSNGYKCNKCGLAYSTRTNYNRHFATGRCRRRRLESKVNVKEHLGNWDSEREEQIAVATPRSVVGSSSGTLDIDTQGGLSSQTRLNTAVKFKTEGARKRVAKLKGIHVPKRKPVVRKTPSNEVAPVVALWNTCQKCGEVFPGDRLLAARKLKRHEINKRCNQDEVKTFQPLTRCPKSGCKKGFRKKRLLKIHLQTDHKNKREDCELCSVGFPSGVLLMDHYRNVHYVQRFLYCSVCKEPYISVVSLDLHRATQHGHALLWEHKVAEQITCTPMITPSTSEYNDEDMEETPQHDLDESQESGQWNGDNENLMAPPPYVPFPPENYVFPSSDECGRMREEFVEADKEYRMEQCQKTDYSFFLHMNRFE